MLEYSDDSIGFGFLGSLRAGPVDLAIVMEQCWRRGNVCEAACGGTSPNLPRLYMNFCAKLHWVKHPKLRPSPIPATSGGSLTLIITV